MAKETKLKLDGIYLVDGTKPDFNIDELDDREKMYFVRTDKNKENGYIYLNKKKYGNGESITKIDCGEY